MGPEESWNESRATGGGVMNWLLARVFVVYVNLNMLVCSLIFFPWARPRETISGLIGRWNSTETGWKRRFAKAARVIVDAIYFWEPRHCEVVHKEETEAHRILYP